MENKLITVFTPTYNRRDCLHKCYQSLKAQSIFNFQWLIIDDGSIDGTDELVAQWQAEEDRFPILYDYKDNGGLHTAYNRGIELADTELFMCIDSDDWLPPSAISEITEIWNRIADKKYVGIMGIDRYEDGTCVGGMFPEEISEMYLYEKLVTYKIPGDKKMVHRTELLKKVAPMPSFHGEKNFNPSYMMYQLDQFGKLYVTNKCFCIVDYQPDGMSSNIYKQYRNSPNSFQETRKLYLSFPNTSFFFKIKQHIHYVSSCLMAGNLRKNIRNTPDVYLNYLLFAPSVILTLFVLYKSRRKQ